ncbi:hypothetical protein BW21_4275 [Burkholderia humptydooensis]|uniref:Succinylglutamate desuccinylase / aspartoacylase family protein n=1 Tax=Burkholderia humptydooensis MSMB43 TaxID=441157 RepID=A0ABN0G273_9BURK|nr:hypothetical protein BW21_4275 [Burkholderia sp. 2002721687]EIP86358.1 succinylglutamate desuccinylase / aspartoacylase family protein [Burkholderia humptydooensis MSMB43]
MTESAPVFPHYSIEVDFPDLDAHRIGNAGVDYVHRFDSGVSGPHVMINALTHGNEVCGAIVVDALLSRVNARRARRSVEALGRTRSCARDPAVRRRG